MNKTENKQVFTDAEYLEKIKKAEIELERVRLASIEYLETLAKVEQAINERKQVMISESKKKRKIVKARKPRNKKSGTTLKCDQCNHIARRLNELEKHKRRHTGEKAFKCDWCNFRFSDKSTLIKHKRIHSGEKPFTCNQCDYKCKTSRELTIHKRRHSGEKPFQCDQCDYSASQSLVSFFAPIRSDEFEKLFFKIIYCGFSTVAPTISVG